LLFGFVIRSNDIGSKKVRKTETFATSSQMSQAARTEQIPLVAPDPLPQRTSANRSTYGTLVGSDQHKSILSQPIAGKSCIQDTCMRLTFDLHFCSCIIACQDVKLSINLLGLNFSSQETW
jgi:hypothetical protein